MTVLVKSNHVYTSRLFGRGIVPNGLGPNDDSSAVTLLHKHSASLRMSSSSSLSTSGS